MKNRKPWVFLALGIIIIIIAGGYCYVKKTFNTHDNNSISTDDNTISGGYDHTPYDNAREHLESIAERGRVSRERLERSQEWIGEIRTESETLGRINNENTEYYGEIRTGADRIEAGLGLIQSGIEQLEELIRSDGGASKTAADNNLKPESHPGDSDNSDNM